MDVREAQGRNLCRAVSSVQPQVRSLGRAQRTLAALFSLRLGEPCDRGRRERLTARVAIK